MKIPTGTSFVSDHRFGVRAVWPSRAERDDSGLGECAVGATLRPPHPLLAVATE